MKFLKVQFLDGIIFSVNDFFSKLGDENIENMGVSTTTHSIKIRDTAVWIGFAGTFFQGYLLHVYDDDLIKHLSNLFSKSYGLQINTKELIDSVLMETANIVMSKTNKSYGDSNFRVTIPRILDAHKYEIKGDTQQPLTKIEFLLSKMQYRIILLIKEGGRPLYNERVLNSITLESF